MSLAKALDSADKKHIFASNDTFVSYPTGILPLDYANGFWLDVLDNDGSVKKVPIIGVMGGSFISIIGSTGTGKSTLADQIGYGIMKDFPDGMLFHIDAELTNLKQRMVRIMGCDPDDERIRLKKEMIYIEDVLTMFSGICAEKEAGGDLYKYDVVDRTYSGKPFKAYVPTVFIIDSLPAFNCREFNVEDGGTNMDAARGAKDITRFFVNCLGRMQHYNITIITINHIKPKVVADRFNAPPAGLQMLKPAEMVSRGYAPQFYSQNYFRCNSLKSDMYKFDDVGFNGFKNTIQIAKTKTSFVGATLDVCFNSDIGFDPIYTLFEFASSAGLLVGNNPNIRLQGMDEFKFSRKGFRHKFIEDTLFRETFLKTLQPYLESLLGVKDISESDRVRFGDYQKYDEEHMLEMEITAEKEMIAEMKKEIKKKK